MTIPYCDWCGEREAIMMPFDNSNFVACSDKCRDEYKAIMTVGNTMLPTEFVRMTEEEGAYDVFAK